MIIKRQKNFLIFENYMKVMKNRANGFVKLTM